jgi:hypothetical protein
VTSVDNREAVSLFIDMIGDGDTFWYTELLDRTTNGSSRFKMLRSFEHNDRGEFLNQCDTIAKLCEQNNVRAYTRLSPRSRKQVAHHMLRTVTDQVLEGHYDALWHMYGSACGKTSIHGRKVWLIDIDRDEDGTLPKAYTVCRRNLEQTGNFLAWIPSKNGGHLICRPHDPRLLVLDGAQLHKDNSTNLYIPGAAR